MAGRWCSGACCKRFTLVLSPGELARAAAAVRAWDEEAGPFPGFRLDDGRVYRCVFQDIVQIAEMVIYLERSRLRADGTVNDEEAHWYTCKHFDTDSTRCTNYSGRPRMCSQYPYEKPCEHIGCSHPPTRYDLPLFRAGCDAGEAAVDE